MRYTVINSIIILTFFIASGLLQAQAAPIPTAESTNAADEATRRAAVAADNKKLDDLLNAREAKKKKASAAVRKKREEAIANYPLKMQALIRERRIQVGWGPEAVTLSWGRPEHINKTTYSFGTHEQWVYNSQCYVYFENGKVTSIQS